MLSEKIKKPSEKLFVQLVEEFWFECYQIAKSLKREDLWVVKFRDAGIKQLLLQMIEWHENVILPTGKRMKSQVGKEIWKATKGLFARFETRESYEALLESIDLFRRLAKTVAQREGFRYPQSADRNITGIYSKTGHRIRRPFRLS